MLVDRLRDRKLLLADIAPNLLLVAVLVLVSYSNASTDRGGDDRASFTIGVSGDLGAVRGLAEDLTEHRFELVPVVDPVGALEGQQVEAALVLHGPDLSRSVVLDRAGSDGSRVAGLLLRAAIADRLRDAAGEPAIRSTTEVPPGHRSQGQATLVVAFVPLMFAISAGRAVQLRLTGARDTGTLEVLLSLPLRRRDLLAGLCTAEGLVCLAKDAIFLALTLLGLGLVAVTQVGSTQALLVVGLVFLAVVTQTIILGLLGALAAAGSSISRFLIVIPVALAIGEAMLSASSPRPLPSGLAAVPGLGWCVGAREMLLGHEAGRALLLAAAATAMALGLLARRAVRGLDSEELAISAVSS